MNMKDEIEKVLNDETLTTNEERVDAIAKGLATLVIPKEKFNDVSERLRNTEANFVSLQNDFDNYKKSKMSDDEKLELERQQFELDKKANARAKSELAVKSLLLDNGIKVTEDDVELKNTLENIISEDLDKSVSLANSFISLMNKTKENTVKEILATKGIKSTAVDFGGEFISSIVYLYSGKNCFSLV